MTFVMIMSALICMALILSTNLNGLSLTVFAENAIS